MPKSSTTLDTFVSPAELHALITDFASYPEFLPEVKRVEIKDKNAQGATVTFYVEVKVGGAEIKTEYTARYTFSEREIRWQLVSSPTLTKNEGFWKLEETSEGETKAQYESELVTTLPIPEEMQKIFADQEMPRMMQRFRDRAEA
jgi:ribosome-associated toxin RatA of RatAB toxin-antitoxin module